MPQLNAGVRVKGVYAVQFGGNIRYVMHALAGDSYARYPERLGIHLAIHREGKELAELTGGNVFQRKKFFDGVGSRSRIVVLLRVHAQLGLPHR